jgi:hypothetical protein
MKFNEAGITMAEVRSVIMILFINSNLYKILKRTSSDKVELRKRMASPVNKL